MLIRALIRLQKVDLVYLQEMCNNLVGSIRGGRCLGWKVVNFRGATGVILIF